MSPDVVLVLVDGYLLLTYPCDSLIVRYTVQNINNSGPRDGIIGV
jgi:hypothetical protein